MNLAQGYGKLCQEVFDEAKPFVNVLGGAYKQNFDKKYAEAVEITKKADTENNKIFYESIIPASELPVLDPQNFVNLTSVAAELEKTPELDNKLRHLIPPAV